MQQAIYQTPLPSRRDVSHNPNFNRRFQHAVKRLVVKLCVLKCTPSLKIKKHEFFHVFKPLFSSNILPNRILSTVLFKNILLTCKIAKPNKLFTVLL